LERPSAPARASSITQELAKVALVVALPLVALLAWHVYDSARTEYRAAAEVTRGHAIRIAGDMHRDLNQADLMLKRLASRPLVRALNPDLCDSLLSEAVALVPGIGNIVTIDATGALVCTGLPIGDQRAVNFADREWFKRQTGTPDVTVSGPLMSRIYTNKPIVAVSRPILGPDGKSRGVVSASIDLIAWDTGIKEIDMPRDVVAGIVDGNGVAVVRSHGAGQWVGKSVRDSPATQRFLAERDGVAIIRGNQGVERVWGFVPVPGTDWIAYAGIPSDVVLGPVVRRVGASAAVVLGTLLAAFALGFVAVKRLSRPILDFAAVVRARAQGDASARPPQAGPSEIREVAREFEHLIDRQAGAQAERDAVIERLRMLLEGMPIACVTYDEDLRVTYVNPAVERILGYTAEESLGRHPFELWVPPHQAEQVGKVFARVRAGEAVNHVRDVRRRDGTRRTVEWYNIPLRDRAGNHAGLLALALDITERVRATEALQQLNAELEQRVAGRTAELEDANRELEAFSYSVAHDLRAPLRAIDGFARVAADVGDASLGPDAAHAFERIHHNVARMARLIDDLLTLARIQRLEIHRIEVDLSTLARSIIDDLRATDSKRSVEVVIAPGLAVRADAALARVVLENLLGNAWKFTSLRDQARIEFLSEDGKLVVRDNGAGFDPRFVGKLFGPFQRLHTEKEFAGTGIGLATVERILRRHGGSISAEGVLGGGATFRFTFGPQDVGPDETFGRKRTTRAVLESSG
jgi:PAS domain S-box-containing protein